MKGEIFQTNLWQDQLFKVLVTEKGLSVCIRMDTAGRKRRHESIHALTFLNKLRDNVYNIKFNLPNIHRINLSPFTKDFRVREVMMSQDLSFERLPYGQPVII